MGRINVLMVNITANHQPILPYSCGLLRSYAEEDPVIKNNTDWQPFLFLAMDGVQKLFEKITIRPDILIIL